MEDRIALASFEIPFGREALEEGEITGRGLAETAIESEEDAAGLELVEEDASDKVGRLDRGQGLIEIEHYGYVDAESLEQEQPVIERHQDGFGGRCRDGSGGASEGEDDAFALLLACPSKGLGEDAPVTSMDAVKGAEGDGGPTKGGCESLQPELP